MTKPGKAVTVVTMDGKYLKSYSSLILYILLHLWLLKLLLKLFLFVFLKDDMISACRTCVVKCAKPRGLLEWMISLAETIGRLPFSFPQSMPQMFSFLLKK